MFVLARCLLCLACQDASTPIAAYDGEVRVGLQHPRTGTLAMSENTVAEAELLAIAEINAAGGLTIDGRRLYDHEFFGVRRGGVRHRCPVPSRLVCSMKFFPSHSMTTNKSCTTGSMLIRSTSCNSSPEHSPPMAISGLNGRLILNG